MKLYRVRKNGDMGMVEIARGNFSDEDKYNEAVEFFYGEGYCDTMEEAREAEAKEAS